MSDGLVQSEDGEICSACSDRDVDGLMLRSAAAAARTSLWVPWLSLPLSVALAIGTASSGVPKDKAGIVWLMALAMLAGGGLMSLGQGTRGLRWVRTVATEEEPVPMWIPVAHGWAVAGGAASVLATLASLAFALF